MAATSATSLMTASSAASTEGGPSASTRPLCGDSVTCAGGGASAASRICRSCQGSMLRKVVTETVPLASDALSVISVLPNGSGTRQVRRAMRSMVTTLPS